MSGLTAIKFIGEFDFSGTVVDNSYESVSLTYSYVETLRPQADDLSLGTITEPSYYIELSGNINKYVDCSLSGDDEIDDAWSLKSFYTTNTSQGTTGTNNEGVVLTSSTTDISLTDGTNAENFKLAWSINSDTALVGTEIEVGSIDYSASGYFPSLLEDTPFSSLSYKITPTLNIDGTLSFSHDYYDLSENIITLQHPDEEKTLYEQRIYKSAIWDGIGISSSVQQPTLTGLSADVFTLTFDAPTLDLSTALYNDLSGADGNTLITKFNFNVTAINPNNNNSITNWANDNSYDASASKLLFEEGQEIWVVEQATTTGNLGKTVELKLNDLSGSEKTILEPVFGIKLVQGSTGARTV